MVWFVRGVVVVVVVVVVVALAVAVAVVVVGVVVYVVVVPCVLLAREDLSLLIREGCSPSLGSRP